VYLPIFLCLLQCTSLYFSVFSNVLPHIPVRSPSHPVKHDC
jgi:hypothetical protein